MSVRIVNRLNRTSVGLKRSRRDARSPTPRCLNRTSVGLKHELNDAVQSFSEVPQSNQRGIETRESFRGPGGGIECLNRTSVGLKRGWGGEGTASATFASIEPAWD